MPTEGQRINDRRRYMRPTDPIEEAKVDGISHLKLEGYDIWIVMVKSSYQKINVDILVDSTKVGCSLSIQL